MLSITPDQIASAGSYISHNWGDYGYRIEGIESPTHAVAVFHVCASDGSRFAVLADKWGNCRHLDTHGHSEDDAPLGELVRDMHTNAVTP
jgi:hypothetical protein